MKVLRLLFVTEHVILIKNLVFFAFFSLKKTKRLLYLCAKTQKTLNLKTINQTLLT